MKHLIVLAAALAALVSSAPAQIYPWRPTAYTYGFQTNATAAQARAYLGITSGGTNEVLLNGTNVFTGTNTFTPANFFPANGIGSRFVLVTNVNFFGDAYTNSTAQLATNSGFGTSAQVCTVTVPAAISTRSAYRIWGLAQKTNTTITAAIFSAYVGSETNWAGSFCQLTASSLNYVFEHRTSAALLVLLGSYTNAVLNAQQGLTGYSSGQTLVDFSVPWTLRVGLASSSSATNIFLTTLAVEEIVVFAP